MGGGSALHHVRFRALSCTLRGAGGGGGQNRLLPPPLHPLPRWGGEALREIALNVGDKFSDFNQ